MMPADSDDVHCDSLAGAELSSPALSVRPSLWPARRSRNWLKLGWVAGALLVAGAVFAHVESDPEMERSDALRVDGQTLSYSEGFARRAGIRTIEVKEAAFSPIVSAVGKTAFDPRQIAAVDANALGTVRRIAKYEGESVKRGDVLAEIGSAGLARIEAASFVRAAGADAPRALGVSVVRSPLEGTVIERHIVTGQSVKGERVVFVVANLDQLACDLQIDESQARALTAGDRVELERDASSAPIDGRVAEVSAGEGGALGSGRLRVVRVEVDNRARHLRPGQAVSAKIYASGGVRALVIPTRAVAWIAGRPAVFVQSGRNSVNASPVTLGGCNGEQTEVSVGLAAGQHVVSDGVRVLKDESFL
ncbi:MAG TPA: efflux RND transporter periplasmic adaptor subunit [Polyangiaceae bacterium]|jgi:cobalt-zinc-cadmium efflux system membrane fusion protein|nr:efflux RND transporter periplasmic adaptor subunit [Polyangiaceae bacterium]